MQSVSQGEKRQQRAAGPWWHKDKVTDEVLRTETTAAVRQINVLCIILEDYKRTNGNRDYGKAFQKPCE